MSVIEIQNLKKYFGKTRAVDNISFSVEKGEIFGFLGPNGAGKTTTIRCLLDFLRPDEGAVRILGLDSKKDSVAIKTRIGYLTGDVRLYDGWTGLDHVQFFEKIRRQPSIAQSLISKFNLNPQVKFRNLSSGNKQKLGIVLCLMFSPELIIMDEPTIGLDPLLQNNVYEILNELQQKGSTIFMSSHNLSEVDRICHKVGIIKDGKLIAIENIQTLKEKRMHYVRVNFAGIFNKNDFIINNVQIQQELPNGLILGVIGDINPLIGKLANYNVINLEISRASLEEIFLEFYGSSKSVNNLPIQNVSSTQTNDLTEIPKL